MTTPNKPAWESVWFVLFGVAQAVNHWASQTAPRRERAAKASGYGNVTHYEGNYPHAAIVLACKPFPVTVQETYAIAHPGDQVWTRKRASTWRGYEHGGYEHE